VDVESLKAQLFAMAAEDARVRAELAADGTLFQGYAPRMAAVHAANGHQLENLIEQHGWPGRTLVGDEAAEAAWLILQHAIGNPGLQRRGVALLRDALERGEIKAHQLAMLEDRVAFFEGRPQRYGTQFDWDDDGRLSPWVIEDPQSVDERRQSIGLEPLADRIAVMRSAERMAPPDIKAYRAERAAWARSVGWV
jgi:hypothetical protein